MPQRPINRVRVVAAAVVLGVASLLPSAFAGSQESISEARAEREALREERAAAAAELDAARAEDAEVAAALRDITDLVNAHQARLDEVGRQLAVNQQIAVDAEAAVAEADSREAELEDEILQLAVSGYVNAGEQSTAALLASEDFGEVLRQNELLASANGNAGDVLEELRILQEDRAVAEAEAEAAVAATAALQTEMETIQADYQAQQAVQAELKAEMEARVADWESQVAAIEAEDQELADFIRAEERRLNPTPVVTSSAPAPGTPSVSGFQWPISGRVSSGFGYRVHPIFGTRRLHRGIDVGASSGTPIAAAKGGTVILAGWNGGYGNCVVISHGDGITSLYAHQSSLAVSVGDTVSRGDIVGYVGSTGQSTGPHLHFEIRVSGTAVDPAPYLP